MEIPTRALTLKQPWAHLVIHGDKDVENRTWKLPKIYLNQWVWLHAGKSYESGISDIPKNDLTFGGIIGAVKFKECVSDCPSKWAIEGRYHWVISDKLALPKPVLCNGNMSFWALSNETYHQLTEMWEVINKRN